MKFDISHNGGRKILGPRFSATKGTYITVLRFHEVDLE